MRTQNVLCVPDYSSNLLSVSRCTEWGHSFTFEKRNNCMKLQKGTRVKLTQENNLFYLPCSVLEFKTISNSLKLDSAWKWYRRLSHLNQADVVKKASETVGNTTIFAMCEHWPRSERLQYKELQKPKQREAGEGVHRRDPIFQSRVTVRVPVLHFETSIQSLCLWTCLRQRVKHWSAWRSLFSVWGRTRNWDKRMRRSFSQSSSWCTV